MYFLHHQRGMPFRIGVSCELSLHRFVKVRGWTTQQYVQLLVRAKVEVTSADPGCKCLLIYYYCQFRPNHKL